MAIPTAYSLPKNRPSDRRPRSVLALVLLSSALLVAALLPRSDSAAANATKSARVIESTDSAGTVGLSLSCRRSVSWPTFRNFGFSDRSFITTGTNSGSTTSAVLRQAFHRQKTLGGEWEQLVGRQREIEGIGSIDTGYKPVSGENWHHTSQIKTCDGVTPILRAVTMVDFDLNGYYDKRQNFREYYCWETDRGGTAHRVRCPGGAGDEDLIHPSRSYDFDLRGDQS